MKFKINYREGRDIERRYPKNEFQIAKNFSTRLYKEFGEFIKAIILFGSASKKKSKINDIDILVVVTRHSARACQAVENC